MDLQDDPEAPVPHFDRWLSLETSGFRLLRSLCDLFPSGVTVLEHYSDYYRLRLERGASLGQLFGLVQSHKQRGLVSEYSVAQTSLEQIFQNFAKECAQESDENLRESVKQRSAVYRPVGNSISRF